MSDALHQAVARAIMLATAEHAHDEDLPLAFEERAAAVAIRVVLAEATRSIEALMSHAGPGGRGIMRAEALAVLASLGDEA